MKLITKAFHILDLFLDHGEELSLDEMSRLSGQNKATVRRIALALIENGYLKQAHNRGKYSLGMRFLDFSGIIKKNNQLTRVASPHLMKLSQSVNESVSLALWDGHKAPVVQYFHADHILRVFPDEGTRTEMHCSGIGKAILAEYKDEELPRFFSGELQRHTPNTICNLEDLKKDLRVVRQEGVAYDDEELALGVRGIGIVLKTRSGEVIGAVGVIGPTVRMSRERLRELAPLMKNVAADIIAEI